MQAAGGVSAIAHPGALLPDRVIEDLAGSGLRGIEIWHPQHNSGTIRRYRALAQRLGLLEPGGSDFHGVHRGVPLRAWHRLRDFAGVAG